MTTTIPHDPGPAQRALCAEFDAYCLQHGLPKLPGDDPMLLNLMTSAQRRWFMDFVDRWDAATEARPATEPVRLLAPQPAPARDVVPGKVRCAKCGFILLRTNLYMGNGTTGPGGEETEPCPNDGTPLLPVSWEHEAREAWAAVEQMFDRAKAAEQALAEAPDYVVAAWQYRTTAGFWVECDHDRYIAKSARGIEVREVFVICPPDETEGQANG